MNAVIWTLTTDDGDGINTTVHATEAEGFETLRANYVEDEVPQGAKPGFIIDAVQAQGVVFYLLEQEVPASDEPVTMRGQDEVGQWMLTIYPDVIELAVRPGDNDTWSAPMRFKREES